MEATPPTPVDIEVVEIALAIAPLALLSIAEEVQLTELPILALLGETRLAIIEVANEEEPDTVGLPTIQVAVKVLTTIDLLGEAVVAGEAVTGTHGAIATPPIASSRASLLAGVFPVAIVGTNSQSHGLGDPTTRVDSPSLAD